MQLLVIQFTIKMFHIDFMQVLILLSGTTVAQWLGCCATNRKVAGSIPDGVSGIFHWHSHYGPGVDSASNKNE